MHRAPDTTRESTTGRRSTRRPMAGAVSTTSSAVTARELAVASASVPASAASTAISSEAPTRSHAARCTTARTRQV